MQKVDIASDQQKLLVSNIHIIQYANRLSTVRSGFTVTLDHSIVQCEHCTFNTKVPKIELTLMERVDNRTFEKFSKNGKLKW